MRRQRGLDRSMFALIFAYCGYTLVALEPMRSELRVLSAAEIEERCFDRAYFERDGKVSTAKIPVSQRSRLST